MICCYYLLDSTRFFMFDLLSEQKTRTEEKNANTKCISAKKKFCFYFIEFYSDGMEFIRIYNSSVKVFQFDLFVLLFYAC